jgi:hypothetical protein
MLIIGLVVLLTIPSTFLRPLFMLIFLTSGRYAGLGEEAAWTKSFYDAGLVSSHKRT